MKRTKITTKRILTLAMVLLLAAALVLAGAGTAGAASTITQEAAKTIALQHAGVAANKVVWKEISLERDDGRLVYELEFCQNGMEYEYELLAADGTVLAWDCDTCDGCGGCGGYNNAAHKNKHGNHNTGHNNAHHAGNKAGNGTNGCIGLQSATRIACDYAGINCNRATTKKAALEYDDGQRVYDLALVCDGYQYEVEVHAYSGKVLEFSKEKLSNNSNAAPQTSANAAQPTQAAPATTQQPAATQKANIGEAKAKQLALQHAGLAQEQVTFTRTRLKTEDGVCLYDVEFLKDNVEYDYAVDAQTGDILEAEQDAEEETLTKSTAAEKPGFFARIWSFLRSLFMGK